MSAAARKLAAVPDQIAEPGESLADYREAFVMCRTFGHAWRVVISQLSPNSASTWLWVIKCRSCRTERHDEVSRVSGSLLHRQYVYPDGYQRPHTHHDRTQFRLELITRGAR